MKLFNSELRLCLFFVFNLKSESEKPPHFWMRGDCYVGFDVISYDSFKTGINIGLSSFSFKVGCDKFFGSAGFRLRCLNFLLFETIFIDCNFVGSANSLQQLRVIGLDLKLLFRTWQLPINIGVAVFLARYSPKISIGVVVNVDFNLSDSIYVGGNVGFSYLIDKNIEGLLENKDFYSSFLEDTVCGLKLDEDCLKVMQKNRENLKSNQSYFLAFVEVSDYQNILIDEINKIKQQIIQAKWDDLDEMISDFQDTHLIKLEDLLKKLYNIIFLSKLSVDYFNQSQVKFLENYISQIQYKKQEQFDLLEEFQIKEDKDKVTSYLKSYLNLLILEILLNPIYLIEIRNTFLSKKELIARNQFLNE